jgi:hypothetical protein
VVEFVCVPHHQSFPRGEEGVYILSGVQKSRAIKISKEKLDGGMEIIYLYDTKKV